MYSNGTGKAGAEKSGTSAVVLLIAADSIMDIKYCSPAQSCINTVCVMRYAFASADSTLTNGFNANLSTSCAMGASSSDP
jgi:hypothetical protein